MKILVTGASGSLGRLLVAHLENRHELVLAGRDRERLSGLFPQHRCLDLTDLAKACRGMEAVLHLAAVNNDSAATAEDFRRGNEELTRGLAHAALAEGVGRFIFLSSVRAVRPRTSDLYATSKRNGELVLAELLGMNISILRLASVNTAEPRGNLGLVNRLPRPLRPFGMALAKAVKPTVERDTVFNAIDASLAGQLDGTHIISERQSGNRVYSTLKRVLDLAGASLLLLLAAFPMLMIAAALLATQGLPVLFRNERLGRERKVFTLYKFRTMVRDAPVVGTHEVPQHVITPLGGFLRRSKLDELPQIYNLFRGELSLVGPRPGLTSQTTLSDTRQKLGVFEAMPGLTGLAQVEGIDMHDPEQLAERDAQYLALRSLSLDVEILLRTVTAVFRSIASRD